MAATLNGNDLSGESRAIELIVFSHTAGIDQQPSTSTSTSPTIKAGHDTMPSVATELGVRRLTPLECERLQGFADGHTLTSNGKPQADGPRYRQMGNAVAVPVAQWVLAGIVEYEAVA